MSVQKGENSVEVVGGSGAVRECWL